MTKFQTNEKCCVPCNTFYGNSFCPDALILAEVITCSDTSCIVEYSGIQKECEVSKVHFKQYIIIICFGDLKNELTNLDPLTKSILQFSRLLYKDSDEYVRFYKIRTHEEFNCLINEIQAHNIIILIGHGSSTGIYGLDSEKCVCGVKDWNELLIDQPLRSKLIISLCCETGSDDFGKEIAKLSSCAAFLAPSRPINSALASQYCQTFLLHHLMDGHSFKVSFDKTEANTIAHSSFQLFENS